MVSVAVKKSPRISVPAIVTVAPATAVSLPFCTPNSSHVLNTKSPTEANSSTVIFSGSESSSSVAASPDPGVPVPSPSIASSAAESTSPPASLPSISSGVESSSGGVLPKSSCAKMISATFTISPVTSPVIVKSNSTSIEPPTGIVPGI